MDIRDLRAFLSIAKHENITRASEELNIAQPPLTRTLHKIEEELGVELFRREKKRLHITEEGRFLKDRAEEIIALLNKTETQIREIGSGVSGTLYIGAIESASNSLLPDWISAFGRLYPQVSFSLFSGTTEDVLEKLDQGLIDIALIRSPFRGESYNSLHIRDERWAVLISKDNKLAESTEDISLAELAKEKLIIPGHRKNEIEGWFHSNGLEASQITCEFTLNMNAVSLIERGMGSAIAPESLRANIEDRPIVMRCIKDIRSNTSMFLIWKREVVLSNPAELFVQFVQKEG